jgi:transcriptional regulator with XRE-family HTH domain
MSRGAALGVAMPLDSSGLSEVDAQTGETPAAAPSIHSGADIGEALKALREARGLTLEELSERTRVRASFLAALEAMRLDELPSRPFVVGYIRAYAQVVGADPDAAAERFKAEEPVLDEPLPAPVGVQEERDPRLGAIVGAAAVIIAAIVAWNVVQRIMTETAPKPPTASDSVAQKALANTTAGPVALGAPLPAPVESTTPPPYLTPGLDKAVNAEGQPLAPPAAPQPATEVLLPKTFTPKGQVYGAPAQQSSIILQALKPAFLVIRGGDGSIYFARQLAEGEAYRAPAIGGLTVDVSEPDAFQVFAYGQSRGLLPQPLSDVGKLAGPPPPAPPAPKPVIATPVASAPAKPPTAAAGQPAGVKPPAATPVKAAAAAKPAAAKPKADVAGAKSPPPKAKTDAAPARPAAPRPKPAAPEPALEDPPTA